MYAIVAPSISSQFTYAKLGQVITAIKRLGFFNVVEVALGADMVAYAEAQELVDKGFLTSSCCPAFVDYIKKEFPQLKEHISHNLSPMGTIAQYIKSTDPTEMCIRDRSSGMCWQGSPRWCCISGSMPALPSWAPWFMCCFGGGCRALWP